MADLLQSGMSWLSGMLKQFASETVAVSRTDPYGRNTETITVQAELGSTLLKLDDGTGGFKLEHTDKDFLIEATDYLFGGVPVEPLRGDRFAVTLNGVTETFEASPYGNDPPWRWTDSYRIRYRIHTKRVG